MSWEIRQGDCIERLREMPDESVQTCVTSPPYWGLRDYGSDDQLGLEPTPEQYVENMVAVFREVRRVLREDGTLWLNLGDSYSTHAAGMPLNGDPMATSTLAGVRTATHSNATARERSDNEKRGGLPEKNLMGIPWRVAFALQQPYYAGRIKDERDRIWLAAMVDAEGCIYIHKRKAGASNGQGYVRKADSYSAGLEVCNTSRAVVERIAALTGQGSISEASMDSRRRQALYRWTLRAKETRDLLRELYPHLVAKRHQARIAVGCPSSGLDASAAHEALKLLHSGGSTEVDFAEPESMLEPGWYLRSDCIWSKPNPMPESVTDRPTKAHEYLFLLSKSARYFYDADAVREEPSISEKDAARARIIGRGEQAFSEARAAGERQPDRDKSGGMPFDFSTGRNKRSVWTVTTQPFPGAHFATFPPKLIEPCILAGSAEGDTVLDPFAGAATTGVVACRHNRSFIGLELNPEYVELGRNRIRDDAPLLNTPEEIAA